jgi:prepilin-type N-terminal cleavage/methylation domain-containing protein/prepilin-type processing-associated H-X9-DG protein
MQLAGANSVRGGFTLIEMICVIAIIALLAALLLPALTKVRDRAKQTQCAGQLREQGIAFHSFAHDHNNRFPVQVPAAEGGSMEFALRANQWPQFGYFAYRHFRMIANELGTPKLLICPTDSRTAATGFGVLSNQNLSYFAGLNAVFTRPSSLLAGDRNLTNDWVEASPVQQLGPRHALRWSHELHRFRGNLLFADGHVEQLGEPRLPVPLQPGAPNTSVFNLPAIPVQTAPSPPPQPSGASAGRLAPFASTAKNGTLQPEKPAMASQPNETKAPPPLGQPQSPATALPSQHPFESRISGSSSPQSASSGSGSIDHGSASNSAGLETSAARTGYHPKASAEESFMGQFLDLFRTLRWLRLLVLLLFFTVLTLVLRSLFVSLRQRT